MKYIRILIILISTILLLLNLKPVTNTYYNESKNTITDSSGSFQGEIIQKRDFVQGDIPSTKDFTITGRLSCNNKVYHSDNLCVLYIDNIGLTHVGNSCTINIRVQNIYNSKEGCSFPIKVKVVKADQKLKCSLEGKVFHLTEDYKTCNGIPLPFYRTITYSVKDQEGRLIAGDINYSDNINEYDKGNNTIQYAFTPVNNYYPVLKGSFIINYLPKYTLSANSLYMQPGSTYIPTTYPRTPTGSIHWTSSDNLVANVNPITGEVKAIHNGDAIITACITNPTSNEQYTYFMKVNVANQTDIISFNKNALSLSINDYFDLNVNTAYSGGKYSFVSNNSNVSVDPGNGIVRAIKKGTSMISCYFITKERTVYVIKCNATIN